MHGFQYIYFRIIRPISLHDENIHIYSLSEQNDQLWKSLGTNPYLAYMLTVFCPELFITFHLFLSSPLSILPSPIHFFLFIIDHVFRHIKLNRCSLESSYSILFQQCMSHINTLTLP